MREGGKPEHVLVVLFRVPRCGEVEHRVLHYDSADGVFGLRERGLQGQVCACALADDEGVRWCDVCW